MEAEKTRVDVESAVQTVYLIAGITAVAMLGVEFVLYNVLAHSSRSSRLLISRANEL